MSVKPESKTEAGVIVPNVEREKRDERPAEQLPVPPQYQDLPSELAGDCCRIAFLSLFVQNNPYFCVAKTTILPFGNSPLQTISTYPHSFCPGPPRQSRGLWGNACLL